MASFSDDNVKLVPIKCTSCGQKMPARGQHIFFYCDHCNLGYELRQQQVHPIDVLFKKTSDFPDYRGQKLPFWAFDARLKIHYRQTAENLKTFLSALGKFLSGELAMGEQDSGGKLIYYVSAYEIKDSDSIRICQELTLGRKTLEDDAISDFTSVCYHSRDAAKLADFIFLSSEIEKPDVVTRLKYTLDLSKPRLVVIRFV